MWTAKAKEEWKAGVSGFNSSEQSKMYQEVEYWANAIGKKQTKRFPSSPNARIWCEVTAEEQTVQQVIWDGS